MLLLIDECVAPPVVNMFTRHNHSLLFVVKELGRSTKDPIIAQYADAQSAVVVTWNHKDFLALMRRKTTAGDWLFPSMGLLGYRCPPLEAPDRIESLLDAIVHEHDSLQHPQRGRLNVLVDFAQFRMFR